MKQLKLTKVLTKLVKLLNKDGMDKEMPYYLHEETKQQILFRRFYKKLIKQISPNSLYAIGIPGEEFDLSEYLNKSARSDTVVYFQDISVGLSTSYQPKVSIQVLNVLTGATEWYVLNISQLSGIVVYHCPELKKSLLKLFSSTEKIKDNIDKKYRDAHKEYLAQEEYYKENAFVGKDFDTVRKEYSKLSQEKRLEYYYKTKQGSKERFTIATSKYIVKTLGGN